MKPEMLVRMANQMEDFFKSQSHDDAVHGIEDHIRRYWDPRMRTQIIAHVANGGAGLTASALAAVRSLPTPSRAV